MLFFLQSSFNHCLGCGPSGWPSSRFWSPALYECLQCAKNRPGSSSLGISCTVLSGRLLRLPPFCPQSVLLPCWLVCGRPDFLQYDSVSSSDCNSYGKHWLPSRSWLGSWQNFFRVYRVLFCAPCYRGSLFLSFRNVRFFLSPSLSCPCLFVWSCRIFWQNSNFWRWSFGFGFFCQTTLHRNQKPIKLSPTQDKWPREWRASCWFHLRSE